MTTKVLFTGKTHTTVANSGDARDPHGRYTLNLSAAGSDSTEVFADTAAHPIAERLFAGAWSACYSSAIGVVAAQKKIALPDDRAVDIEVDLCQSGTSWFLQARFDIRLPGLAQDVAEQIAHEAHAICPYSKATKGNIGVTVNVVTA